MVDCCQAGLDIEKSAAWRESKAAVAWPLSTSHRMMWSSRAQEPKSSLGGVLMLYSSGSGLNMRQELLVLPFFITTTQKIWDPVIMSHKFEPLKNDLLIRTAWGMIFIIPFQE